MSIARVARSHNLVDSAAESAEQAIRTTQNATNKALDNLSNTLVGTLRDRGAPALDRAREQASTYAHRGIDNMRDLSHRVRAQAHHASDTTVGFIRDEPVKAVLIAAATGALLIALVNLFKATGSRR